MTGEPVTTVVGNTTAPAELRFTQAGVAVANFTVAQTPRTFNKQTNQWEDGQTLFMRCNVWRDQAENVAETLSEKGVRVVVTGTLQQSEFTDREGNQRTVIEMKADEVGVSMKYATAQVHKVNRRGGGAPQGGYQQGNVPGYPQQGQQPQQGNPWGGQPQQAPQQGQGAPQGQWGGQPQGQPQQSPWAGGGQQAPQQPMPGVGDLGGPPF